MLAGLGKLSIVFGECAQEDAIFGLLVVPLGIRLTHGGHQQIPQCIQTPVTAIDAGLLDGIQQTHEHAILDEVGYVDGYQPTQGLATQQPDIFVLTLHLDEGQMIDHLGVVFSKSSHEWSHLQVSIVTQGQRKVVRLGQDLDAMRYDVGTSTHQLLEGGTCSPPHIHLPVVQHHHHESLTQGRQEGQQHFGIVGSRGRPSHVTRTIPHIDADRVAALVLFEDERLAHDRDDLSQTRLEDQSTTTYLSEGQTSPMPSRITECGGEARLEERREDVISLFEFEARTDPPDSFGGRPPHNRILVGEGQQQIIDDHFEGVLVDVGEVVPTFHLEHLLGGHRVTTLFLKLGVGDQLGVVDCVVHGTR